MDKEIDFRIISTKNLDNLKLTRKQIVVLLEGLNHYRKSLQEVLGSTKESSSRIFFEYKIKEVNNLFSKLESSIEFDFEKAVNKCAIKKKKDEEEPGMETMSWLGNTKDK